MDLESFLDKHGKTVVVLLFIIIVGCIAGMVGLGISNYMGQKTFVTVMVAPTTAKVSLNDEIYSAGLHEIEPGEYRVRIWQDGFTTKEYSINVKHGDTASIVTYLVNEARGMKYYDSDSNSLNVLYKINSENDEQLHDYLYNYSRLVMVRDVLPLDASFTRNGQETKVTIEDGSRDARCDMAFCLMATGENFDVETIEQALRVEGYYLDNYKIIYNYTEEE